MEPCNFSACFTVDGGPTPPRRPRTYLVQPRGDPMVRFRACLAFAQAAHRVTDVLMDEEAECAAFLRNLNNPWQNALNRKKVGDHITHFAMIHADVCPPSGWLDTMIEEMIRVDADVISAVVPFRDFSGLTSVGIDNPRDEFAPRRLTLTETCNLPETFSIKDTDTPDSALLINTGLFVAKLDNDWAADVVFDFKVRIGKATQEFQRSDGTKFNADMGYFEQESEDWRFARFLAQRGVTKVFCTRKVPVVHVGYFGWTNQTPDQPLGNGKTSRGMEIDECYRTKMVLEAAAREKEIAESAYQRGLAEGRQSAVIHSNGVPSNRIEAMAEVGGMA